VSHPIVGVRLGLARALIGRHGNTALELVERLASDSECAVRQVLADGIRSNDGWEVPDSLILRLVADEDSDVAQAVVPALGRRSQLHDTLIDLMRREEAWWGTRKAAAHALGFLRNPGPRVLVTLIEALAEEDFEPVARECAASAERHLGGLRGATPIALPALSALNAALAKLRAWRGEPFPKLRALLMQHEAPIPDLAKLATFGRDLTAEAERGRLHRAYHVEDPVEALVRVLGGSASRSAVLLGPSGVGKTAIVYELVHRLAAYADSPWRVIRVVPSELLVGTKYLGEWQTRVKELIELVAAPQRVLLYVPNLEELSDVGKASNDQSNVATMLSPHIESGRIALLGEATHEGWARGLGRDASLRRLFAQVEVPPMPRRKAREVVELVAAEAEIDVAPEAFERLF
jgi:ATP-dependent Clp protease ATP-binding subunit ClpA